jgi:ABC-type nitrate/sulfonate/bicarbonate transport system substrate-binding protein
LAQSSRRHRALREKGRAIAARPMTQAAFHTILSRPRYQGSIMRRRISSIVLVLAGACMAEIAQGQSLITLRYGQNAAGISGLSSLPLNVALRKDAFRREGIDLVMIPIPGGTDRIVAALDKGEIDAGKNATPYMIQAALGGSDAVAIISQTANPVYSLIVRPGIKSFADLKGKTLGLSTGGDTITLSTVRLLTAKGIKASDYTAKAVVGTPARFACLKSGECAAVPMGQPEDIEAIKEGFPRLGFTYEAGADLIFNVDMVRRAWGEKNKDTLVRFVRAMASTYAFMNDPKNRDEVVTIVKDTGKLSDDIARQIFAPYLDPGRNVLPRRGEISLPAFNRVLALMGDVGAIPKPAPPAERFVDLQYLRAAGIQ